MGRSFSLLRVFIFACANMFVACNCGDNGASDPTPGPGPGEVTDYNVPVEPIAPCERDALAPGTGAKVFVDTSVSMAGFVDDDDTELSIAAIYRELSGALTDAEVLPVSLCPVGEDEEVPCAASANGDELVGERAFDASRATLALLMEDPATIGTAAVVSLITDGTESPLEDGRALNDGCTPSATNFCLLRAISRMADEGWTVFVTVVKLEFDGKIYHESELSSADFDEIVAYVEEAERRAEYSGIPMEAERHRGTSYEYEGPRPLMIITLARDPVIGARAVDNFERRLRRPNFAYDTPDGAIEGLQLNGHARGAFSFDDAVGVQVPAAIADGPPVLRIGSPFTRVDGGGARVGLRCNNTGRSPVVFRVAGDTSAGEAHLRPTIIVDGRSATLGPPAVPNPLVALHTASADPADYRTGVRCLDLNPGFYASTYELRVGRTTHARAPGWWSANAWSTTEPTRHPDRVFRLADLVTDVTQSDALEPCVADRLTIVYERPER